MGGRVSNIGAARRFPRWEGHWKTPTDQPMAAGSRSECTRRESAAKRSAIWDWMAGETRCEHSCWKFLAMVAMRTKGQLGNANFSSFSWRSEPEASTHVRSSPSACLQRRETDSRFRASRWGRAPRGEYRDLARMEAWLVRRGTTGPILSPLIFSLKAVPLGGRRKWQAVGLAAAPESASRVYAWGEISDRRGSTAIGRQAQCQKGHPACTHGVGF